MQDYIEKTNGMEENFKMLVKKDGITARIIEKWMQQLIMHHNQMAQLKKALIIKGCKQNYFILLIVEYISNSNLSFKQITYMYPMEVISVCWCTKHLCMILSCDFFITFRYRFVRLASNMGYINL